MKLYTGYFAKHGKSKRAVAITRRKPSWFKGRHEPRLAPSTELLEAWLGTDMTKSEYAIRFQKQLDALTPLQIEDITREALKDGDILVCYEKPDKFCHRHLVAEFLRKLGHTVNEMD